MSDPAGSGFGLEQEVASIASSLKEHPAEAVAVRLAAALAQWPNQIRLRLLQGEFWERAGMPDRATACYVEAAADFPTNPWPHLRLARCLIERGDIEAAIPIFVERVWTGPLPEQERCRLLNRFTTAITASAKRARMLEDLLRNTPDDRFILVKLASLRYRSQDKDGAVALLDRAAALGPLPPESAALRIELLILSGRPDEAFLLAREMVAGQAGRPDLARRAIQAAKLANRTEEMVTLLSMALERWPDDWLLVFRYNRSACPFDVDRELFEHLLAREEIAATEHRWRFQFAIACLRHQQTDHAMQHLQALGPGSPVAHMAVPTRDALQSRDLIAWCNPRRASNDPARDLQIIPQPGAIATIIVFAGLQGGLGYLPYSHADVILAEQPVNVIYLRDAHHLAFAGGVAGLGPDEMATVAALQRIGVELGGMPLIAIGASLGGAAAVRYAILLRAAAAISFSAPLHWSATRTEEEAEVPSKTRLRNALFTTMTHAERSIIEMVAGAPATTVYHCYGAQDAADAAIAAQLAHLPNVVLEKQDSCADHFVIEHMIATRSFDALMFRVAATDSLCRSRGHRYGLCVSPA